MGAGLAVAALVAAVAGGSLGITASPTSPRVGRTVTAFATGYPGDHGHLYIYRMAGRECAHTQRSARLRGTRLAYREVRASFEVRVSFTPRRVRREWICGYLYSHACDAAGANCGPALGLPPDAGFARVPIRVRPRQ